MALVRAVPLKSFLDSALSTSIAGTAYTTDAPVSGQSYYAGLHFTSAPASTARICRVTIQAASSSGFSLLTTEIEFTLSGTSEGSTWYRNTAPSTDRPWRRAFLTMSTAASTAGTWKGHVWGGIR